MTASERLYLTAEGRAEMLKYDWFKTLNNICDIMSQIAEDNDGSSKSPLSPKFEAQMALKEDLEQERQKHDKIGDLYREIMGVYPDGMPF